MADTKYMQTHSIISLVIAKYDDLKNYNDESYSIELNKLYSEVENKIDIFINDKYNSISNEKIQPKQSPSTKSN